MIHLKHKPVFEHPYVIYRETARQGTKMVPDIWSEPRMLCYVNPNDFRTLRSIEEQLRAPEIVENEPRLVNLYICSLDKSWELTIGQVHRGLTEVRVCLPAGTIFAAFSV